MRYISSVKYRQPCQNQQNLPGSVIINAENLAFLGDRCLALLTSSRASKQCMSMI